MQDYKDFVVLEGEEAPDGAFSVTFQPMMTIKGAPITIAVGPQQSIHSEIWKVLKKLSPDYWMDAEEKVYYRQDS